MGSEILQLARRHVNAIDVRVSEAGIGTVGVDGLSICTLDRSIPFTVLGLLVREFANFLGLPIEQRNVYV